MAQRSWWMWCGLCVVVVCAACGGDGGTGRDDAIDSVLDMVDSDSLEAVEVYATVEPLPAGTEIATEWDDTLVGPRVLTTLTEDAWLFFVDLHPGYAFEHDARVLVVAADDLTTDSFDVGWWPLIDGVDRWRTAATRDASGERVFSKQAAAAPAARVEPPVRSATVPSYCMAGDIQKWALTVGASDDIAIEPSTANELGLLLKTHGYQADVLQPGSLTQGKQSVFAALANIRTKITMPDDGGYCDELMVAWNGHGSKGGHLLIVDSNDTRHWITGAELAEKINETTAMIEGMQVRVAIDSCYSGVHIPTFMTEMPVDPNATGPDDVVRDVHVITATTATEQSVGDILPGDTFLEDIIDCINDDDAVDVSGWLACTRDQAATQTPQEGSWFNNGAQ